MDARATTRTTYFAAIAAVLSSTTWFVLSTTALDQVPDAALVGGATLVAVVLAAAFAGVPRRPELADRSRLRMELLGGALAFGMAPLLVLSQRATDAPSGSETLFFTTAAWGVVMALVPVAMSRGRDGLVRLAASFLALLGVAGLLANWERPSSFSPFIKFPEAEVVMIAAGLAFVVGVMVLSPGGSIRRGSATVALLGGLAVCVVALPFGGFGLASEWQHVWPQVALLGAAVAAAAIAWPRVATDRGLGSASALLFLPPLAVTSLAVVERATGPYGPNPVLWSAALASACVTAAAVVVVWTHFGGSTQRRMPAFVRRAPLAFAVSAAMVAMVGLARPAFTSTAEGVLADGQVYHVTWTMVGAEAAAGWLPLLVALLLVAGAWRDVSSAAARIMTAVAAGIALVSYPFLLATPLHTWTRWVPAEVQQSYGTEYARFLAVPVPDPWRLVAVGLGAAAAVSLVFGSIASQRGGAEPTETVEELG